MQPKKSLVLVAERQINFRKPVRLEPELVAKSTLLLLRRSFGRGFSLLPEQIELDTVTHLSVLQRAILAHDLQHCLISVRDEHLLQRLESTLLHWLRNRGRGAIRIHWLFGLTLTEETDVVPVVLNVIRRQRLVEGKAIIDFLFLCFFLCKPELHIC